MSGSTCGTWPAASAAASVATPRVASSNGPRLAGKVVVVGAWRDCVRPDTAVAETGDLIQWQAAELVMDGRQVVLADGTALGRITKILEWRPPRPGTYAYRIEGSPALAGTIIVSAPATPTLTVIAPFGDNPHVKSAGTVLAIPAPDRVIVRVDAVNIGAQAVIDHAVLLLRADGTTSFVWATVGQSISGRSASSLAELGIGEHVTFAYDQRTRDADGSYHAGVIGRAPRY